MSRALRAIRREWRRSDRLLALATIVVTMVLVWFSLELWAFDLAVPFQYYGDAIAVGHHFQTAIETGGYEFAPRLDAPWGQVYHDFPTADNLHFLAAALLGLVLKDWAVGMNVYFLVGFPLAALAAMWFLRRIGVSRAMALAMAVAFALAPYHFTRGEGHLWLASYYTVPLALFLVLEVMRGRPLVTAAPARGLLTRWLTWPSIRTLLIVVVTGTAQTYYAVFFLVLLALAGIFRLAATRRWRAFWTTAAVGVLTAVVVLINMAPDIVYRWMNGPNPTGFARANAETEIYALKLAQLILPWPGHRIGPLREIREAYDANYPLISEQPALGLLGALGFLALLVVVAFAAASFGGRLPRWSTGWRFRRLSQLGFLALVAFLFATVGGLSSIISFATDALRGWNRISIVIALLALAGLGLLIDGIVHRVFRRTPRGAGRAVTASILAVLLVATVYVDQTPRPGLAAEHRATQQTFAGDRAFFTRVEEALPEAAMVLQLPYQPYPEELSLLGVLGSDSLRPYLHTQKLRWSGGGIQGRPTADWPGMVERLDPESIPLVAAAAGFDGILLDTADLTATARNRYLDAFEGLPEIVSDDGRYRFFDITNLRARIDGLPGLTAQERDELARAITEPVIVQPHGDFAAAIVDDEIAWLSPGTGAPSLLAINDRDEAIETTLGLRVRYDESVAGRLELQLPDGSRVPLPGDAALVEVAWSVASGTHVLPIVRADGTAPGTQIELRSVSTLDESLSDFLEETASAS